MGEWGKTRLTRGKHGFNGVKRGLLRLNKGKWGKTRLTRGKHG